jgi:hypothetical protein
MQKRLDDDSKASLTALVQDNTVSYFRRRR